MFVSKKGNNSISSTVAVAKNVIQPAVIAKEPKWGRYIPDPPSSIYSATTLGNRSGLLTPSSTLTKDKHSEFYNNCSYTRKSIPSLPPPSPYREYSSDYLLKGGDYLGSKSSDYNDTSNSKLSSAYYYGDRSPSSSYYYKYSSNYSGNGNYHGIGGKRGDNEEDHDHDDEGVDEEEQDRYNYTYNSQKPLRVNTAYHPPSSFSDKEPESAATLTTPLYSKFSSKSSAFDLSSDRKYNSYY